MAKPRKQKNDEQKTESSGVVVLHQKLCVSVDMEKRRIFGYTELKIIIPEDGHMSFNADNMIITNISVDGESVEFTHFPHYQVIEEDSISSVSCPSSAADVACSVYISSLDKETVPNLHISYDGSGKINQQQEKDNGENSAQDSISQQLNCYNGHSEDKNVKLVRIDYWIDRAETGIHFADNMLLTDSQIRRVHCWFPCLDSISQRTLFDLEFTVDATLIAVSSGDLLHQVLSKDDPPRKTFVYKLTTPVSARWITLVVAPFEILPDNHSNIISHICLSQDFKKLQNTVGFLHNVLSQYEDYLSTSFPFGSYKQIFIPPELTISSWSFGASLCIFGSDILFDDSVIDQTIDTRIKLAHALARQWFGVYITADEPTDEWLLDGLAGFLTDTYIKRFLGNNEARYRRYKANLAVCKADVSGATALSSSAASSDLYGTQQIGLYGKIRSWKAIAVLQMLEKQIGPESFRKILQIIVKPNDSTRSMRKVSTKEFRHLANKVGNLERPFLKEFFPRWVESCGCPILRMGLSYNKRRNMIELAVIRGCTAKPASAFAGGQDDENRESDIGWPGMMTVRVHELDGVYDHPVLPMAGEMCQLIEIQCHAKLAAKRFQKPKKGSKPDGSDDNADGTSTQDIRSGIESPLLWVRVDPEMEYLAETQFYQPVQMWINQLEKDKDVIAQSHAISMLKILPQVSFAVVNALNSFLNDSKAFWRVRIEAAYALAHTTSSETDLAGLLHLIKFYKSRRFDADIGLPRPNNFHDVPEYFVLEAIPHAVALVRASDKKSPREAIEFVLQLLKYNDNSGNPYSDVYWLSALVKSIGEVEFGQQGILLLPSLLKRIDQLLQFDRLMPSYNGILTVSCIRTLVQIALKMPNSSAIGRIYELIKPYRNVENSSWKVRIEASRALLDLKYHSDGIDAVLTLFMNSLERETSLRGEVKLAVHVMHICQVEFESETDKQVQLSTSIALLRLLTSRKAFNNIFLRHYLFCILQILAGRSPTLHGVPRVQLPATVSAETGSQQVTRPVHLKLKIPKPQEPVSDNGKAPEVLPTAETNKEGDTISNCSEKRVNVIKIRVKQLSSSSKADEIDHHMDYSRACTNDAELGPCSSVSVDAPARATDPLNVSNQNNLEADSAQDRGSRMTASIGSAKIASMDELGKDLQCTADSRLAGLSKAQLSPTDFKVDETVDERATLQEPPMHRLGVGATASLDNELLPREKKYKDKEKKRKRDDRDKKGDPEYMEKKRLKKERKRMEKELAKMQKDGDKVSELKISPRNTESRGPLIDAKKAEQDVETHVVASEDNRSETTKGTFPTKLRIKIKSRNTDNN
ncbi:transcription initiation factor TFIID subunit 2 [Curcuma longa]|uniref:transcription initiation factor TFIID subunit 2 n=1 Tax=Curcuma longa TaxID=136217 RepID=UPI003D9DEE5D